MFSMEMRITAFGVGRIEWTMRESDNFPLWKTASFFYTWHKNNEATWHSSRILFVYLGKIVSWLSYHIFNANHLIFHGLWYFYLIHTHTYIHTYHHYTHTHEFRCGVFNYEGVLDVGTSHLSLEMRAEDQSTDCSMWDSSQTLTNPTVGPPPTYYHFLFITMARLVWKWVSTERIMPIIEALDMAMPSPASRCIESTRSDHGSGDFWAKKSAPSQLLPVFPGFNRLQTWLPFIWTGQSPILFFPSAG